MTSAESQMPAQPSELAPETIVRLRDDPPRVMRLSRRVIISAAGIASAVVIATAVYALLPEQNAPPRELFKTGAVALPEQLTNGPRDYGGAPKLGPPLPGDLGKPILDAGNPLPEADPPPIAAPSFQTYAAPEVRASSGQADALRQQRDAARASQLFFPSRAQPDPQAVGPYPPASDVITSQNRLAATSKEDSDGRLSKPANPRVIQAGTVIAAALITGIQSDLPGMVIAQVTENVYDSPSGSILLIPQGARLIGDYSADVGFGQNRVQLQWTRLILPDGRSQQLASFPATDTAGYAGLKDKTDYHWAGVFKAAMISTLLGAGAEFGAGDDGNLVRALRRGSQDSINRAGEQIVSRELNIRPSLTIRPGFPVRVMVTRDFIMDDAR